MADIVLVTGNHACNNPRAVKEADALAAAGHRVEVLGAWVDANLAARDRALLADRPWRYTPVADLTRTTVVGRSARLAARVRRRMGVEAYRHLRWTTSWQLGYATPELASAVLRRRADLLMVHSEAAMEAVAPLLGKRPVGIDMEDWFSEDLLPEARADRPLERLRTLERRYLTEGVVRLCTSQAMSTGLSAAYDCSPPTPIYNVFPWSERATLDGLRADRRSAAVSIHWFSQSIGPGRGLEDLFAALDQLHGEFEVHLRGTPVDDIEGWLTRHVSPAQRERIFLHAQVPNAELLSRIAEHDIGLATEQATPPSRDLTVTNKLFQYLIGGLAVVATDTAGQREVLHAAPEAGLLCRPGDPTSLAEALNTYLDAPERLAAAKRAALAAAESRFCWERESPRLVAAVEEALARR